jgi:hypothetical protein
MGQLAGDDDVELAVEGRRDLSRDDDTTARQPEHDRSPREIEVRQARTEATTGLGSVAKRVGGAP